MVPIPKCKLPVLSLCLELSYFREVRFTREPAA